MLSHSNSVLTLVALFVNAICNLIEIVVYDQQLMYVREFIDNMLCGSCKCVTLLLKMPEWICIPKEDCTAEFDSLPTVTNEANWSRCLEDNM